MIMTDPTVRTHTKWQLMQVRRRRIVSFPAKSLAHLRAHYNETLPHIVEFLASMEVAAASAQVVLDAVAAENAKTTQEIDTLPWYDSPFVTRAFPWKSRGDTLRDYRTYLAQGESARAFISSAESAVIVRDALGRLRDYARWYVNSVRVFRLWA